MAPSHNPDLAYDDEESQVPPWAESPNPLTQVQPAFTPLQSSQFGFRLPSQTTKPSRGGEIRSSGLPLEHAVQS